MVDSLNSASWADTLTELVSIEYSKVHDSGIQTQVYRIPSRDALISRPRIPPCL